LRNDERYLRRTGAKTGARARFLNSSCGANAVDRAFEIPREGADPEPELTFGEGRDAERNPVDDDLAVDRSSDAAKAL